MNATRIGSALVLCTLLVLGCSDDGSTADGAGGGNGSGGSGGGGCPDVSGPWNIVQHCSPDFIGMSVTIEQTNCSVGVVEFDFSGMVGEDGSFQVGGTAGGMTIECNGAVDGDRIIETCTGDCNVEFER